MLRRSTRLRQSSRFWKRTGPADKQLLYTHMEAALRAVATCWDTVENTRRIRDDLAQTWDTTLAALKRGARAAADDGAPGLYAALFGRPSRSTKKTITPTPAPASAAPVTPVATAA